MTVTQQPERVIRQGTVHAKAKATDPVYQDFAVREWAGGGLDGYVEYYHVGPAKWVSLPAAWANLIQWDE